MGVACMKRSKKAWLALVCVVALLPVVGCNDDDVLDVPVDQAVEAGLNSALTETIVPLVQFMGAVGDLLTAPIAQRAVAGTACPDTSGWCSSGTATCSQGANGLDFDFDECQVVTGDAPLLLDGNVTAVPGSPILLTLTNLFINNEAPISGTGQIDVNNCDYTVSVATDAATIAGTVTKCDQDDYPTGDVVGIGFSGYLVTITFNGTNTAPAVATQDGTPVADCTINLDSFTSSCDTL